MERNYVTVTNAKIKLFADDTNLFFYSKDLVKLFALANIGMSQLYDWFTANKLSLNVDKTCYSVFGPTHTHTHIRLTALFPGLPR